MEDALKELHAIAFSDDGFHTPIENTILYQAVQNAEYLYANKLLCPPEVLLLIAEIAATSPTLLHISMWCNTNLAEHGPGIATALAASDSIEQVEMGHCNLAEYSPATATALANSNSIVKVSMSYNNLAEHGPATATALATSNTIQNVNMDGNNLAEYGPATATALANSNSIETVYMCLNNLVEHAPATAAALTNSNSIKFVSMQDNNREDYTTATQDVYNTYNDNLNTLRECLHDPNVLPLQEDHLTTLIGQYVDTNITFFSLVF